MKECEKCKKNIKGEFVFYRDGNRHRQYMHKRCKIALVKKAKKLKIPIYELI